MKNKVILYSPLHFEAPSANAIRMRHFVKELKQDFDIYPIFPLLPLVKNTRPFWWRLIREVLSGVELAFRLFFLKYDFVILSSPPYITILLASLPLAIFRRKFILDIRDPYPEVFFELGLFSKDSPPGKLLTVLTRFSMSRSLGVIAATEGIGDIIRSYQMNKKIVTAFNGFGLEEFKNKKNIEKFETFTLIFYGNLARMQNIDLLLGVARKCPDDINIIVAGSGPWESVIAKEERINFLGLLPREEILNIVSKSHVGLSFRNEGLINRISFPVRVFEYIGSGIPVISTPYSEAGYFLERHKAGYQFQNCELEKIVEKIIFLKNNYQEIVPPPEIFKPNRLRDSVQSILE